MTISIIIPTYNEEESIEKLIFFLKQQSNDALVDIIVADGGSSDKTLQVAKTAGAQAVLSPAKGRAAQMNYGAALAKGDVLYFIHADCFPPTKFITDIQQAVQEGFELGRYRTKFDSNKTILKINAWFTRFDLFICMGGDQTLFIKRSVFENFGGFREEMKIMEEYEFCERVRKKGKYKIMAGAALISARKYDTNSWLQVQLANAKVVRMYKKGATQDEMLNTYRKMLSYRKDES